MKEILSIIKHDICSIHKKPFAIIILIGLIVIPSFYAWFNIYACWDPYGNTKSIKVAVSNLDEGKSVEGLNINAGASIIDGLTKNDQLGWTFISETQAKQMVKSGKVYAAVIIPKSFTTDLLSVLTDYAHRPKLEYYVNEKKNAIATKITDKGVDSVLQKISQTFIDETTNIVGNIIKDANIDMKDGENGVVDNFINSLEKTSEQLQDFKKTVNAFCSMSDSMEKMMEIATSSLPQQSIQSAQAAASDFQNVISSVDTLFSGTSSSLSTLFENLDSQLSQLQNLIDNASNFIGIDAQKASDVFDKASKQCESIVSFNNSICEILKQMGQKYPSLEQYIKPLIERIENINLDLNDLKEALGKGAEQLKETSKLSSETATKILELTSRLKQSVITLKGEFDRDVAPKIDKLGRDLISGVSNLGGASKFFRWCGLERFFNKP